MPPTSTPGGPPGQQNFRRQQRPVQAARGAGAATACDTTPVGRHLQCCHHHRKLAGGRPRGTMTKTMTGASGAEGTSTRAIGTGAEIPCTACAAAASTRPLGVQIPATDARAIDPIAKAKGRRRWSNSSKWPNRACVKRRGGPEAGREAESFRWAGRTRGDGRVVPLSGGSRRERSDRSRVGLACGAPRWRYTALYGRSWATCDAPTPGARWWPPHWGVTNL